jgi:uncharacterized protein
MDAKLIYEHQGEKTFALIFDKGKEVMGGLASFATNYRLSSSRLTAIGAFSRVTLGFFDREQKDYLRIPMNEQVEVLSLMGNITLDKDEPKVHVHVVVGKRDGAAYGGHLLEGYVWPTLEVIIVELPKYLRRRTDEETGLALIELGSVPTGHRIGTTTRG